MSEFLTGGITGDTFEQGRIKINKLTKLKKRYVKPIKKKAKKRQGGIVNWW